MENCRICGHSTELQFKRKILLKYEVGYSRCHACGFMQTDKAFWLEEAYSSAITSLDIGLLERNNWLRKEVTRIIDSCFPNADTFLDYAGGYGVFTRLMRDAGFNFYRQDPFCENIFSKHFDSSDAPKKSFDVVTAFEVFEHFADPIPEIEKMLQYSKEIIFSTVLQPQDRSQLNDWWYIAEETGQHLSFYTFESLQVIADKYRLNLYSNRNNLHIFTTQTLSPQQVAYGLFGEDEESRIFGLKKTKFDFEKKRPSLLDSDFKYLKLLLHKN
jgi:hypothetical protein